MASQPEEFNILTTVQGKLVFSDLPDLNYWLQSFTLPTLELEGGNYPGMKRDLIIPGGKLNMEPMTVNFLVDQDFATYQTILEWMLKISTSTKPMALKKDATLHVLTGLKNVSRQIEIRDIFPRTVTDVTWNIDDPDSVQMVCSFTFTYSSFNFGPLGDTTDGLIEREIIFGVQ